MKFCIQRHSSQQHTGHKPYALLCSSKDAISTIKLEVIFFISITPTNTCVHKHNKTVPKDCAFSEAFEPGVMAFYRIAPFIQDMSVDLCGSQVFVSQQLLYCADVIAHLPEDVLQNYA